MTRTLRSWYSGQPAIAARVKMLVAQLRPWKARLIKATAPAVQTVANRSSENAEVGQPAMSVMAKPTSGKTIANSTRSRIAMVNAQNSWPRSCQKPSARG